MQYLRAAISTPTSAFAQLTLSLDTWAPILQDVDINRYAYAGNDSINFSDPNGHHIIGTCGAQQTSNGITHDHPDESNSGGINEIRYPVPRSYGSMGDPTNLFLLDLSGRIQMNPHYAGMRAISPGIDKKA